MRHTLSRTGDIPDDDRRIVSGLVFASSPAEQGWFCFVPVLFVNENAQEYPARKGRGTVSDESLNRDGFGQVAGLVNVAAAADSHVISKQLHRNDCQQGSQL